MIYMRDYIQQHETIALWPFFHEMEPIETRQEKRVCLSELLTLQQVGHYPPLITI